MCSDAVEQRQSEVHPRATSATPPPSPALAAALAEYRRCGLCVLRGALSAAEVDRLARPICGAFRAGDYDEGPSGGGGPRYPAPGVYSMGPRVLATHPEVAHVSLAHPRVLAAVEAVLGEEAVISQFWSIMRPPGAGVTPDRAFVEGSLTHYDYKPWRCVGSFLHWCFAIIPFVNYTETAGPLLAAPGSHTETQVRPSDGRLCQVDAAQVPTSAAAAARLVDPKLAKGDVLIMNGFCWHEARPNTGSSDRAGLCHLRRHICGLPRPVRSEH